MVSVQRCRCNCVFLWVKLHQRCTTVVGPRYFTVQTKTAGQHARRFSSDRDRLYLALPVHDGNHEQCDDVDNLDHRVDSWTRSVFVRIADGVAGYRSLMSK
jgi:hypothetical protein